MSELSVIETYCIFKDKPRFTPAFSPIVMLNYGIHEGCVLNLTYEGIPLPPDIFRKIDDAVEDAKTFSRPNPEHNYYKTMEEVPPFTELINGRPIDSKTWFAWYINFYYKARHDWDDQMIKWWDQVILWGLYSAPKTHAVDQMLLHYSWNPGFDFKTRHNAKKD